MTTPTNQRLFGAIAALALMASNADAAQLVIATNAANWSSNDARRARFPSMEACNDALKNMRIATTSTQSGDKAGMIAVAFCTEDETFDQIRNWYADTPKDIRK